MAHRGVVGIGTRGGKFDTNWGTLVRSARSFGADYAFTVDARYRENRAAVGHDRHFPIFEYADDEAFFEGVPRGATVVRVDLDAEESLPGFRHPEKAVYVLGAEDSGFSEEFRVRTVGVRIETEYCLNQASAGTVVLYDRQAKKAESGIFPMLNNPLG